MTSNPGAKIGLRRPSYAFTGHGVAMLSSVLTSKSAVGPSILVIRAFVRLREYLATHKDLARKLEDVERTQQEHSAKNRIDKKRRRLPCLRPAVFGVTAKRRDDCGCETQAVAWAH